MTSVFFQIARNTFKECIREPVYLVLLLISLSLNGLMPAFALFVFRAQEKLVRDSDMATMMLFGMITAVLCASNAINREIRNGTALLVLSKPISRPLFISAKISGILAVVAIFCLLNSLTTLIALRVAIDQFKFDNLLFWGHLGVLCAALLYAAAMNYIARKNFSQQALLFLLIAIPLWAVLAHFRPDHGKEVGLQGQTAMVLFILSLAILAMGVISTALSTTLSFVGNLTVSSFIFMLGLMSQFLFGLPAQNGNFLANIVYALIPNWQEFWMADAISSGTPVPATYAINAFIYFCYIVGIFYLAAVLLFQEREVGNQNIR